jgi:phosphoglycolate phosphatase
VPGAVRDDEVVSRFAPDSLIFDFDGVIVDSYAAVTGSINAALVEHGLAARPVQTLRHYIGPPTFTAFRELTGAPEGSPEIDAIVATYRRHYAAVYLTATRAIDGIVPVLETLSQRLPLALATSKSVLFTQPLLAALGLERFFVVVEAAASNDSSDDKAAIVGRAIAVLAARGCRHPAMVGDRSFDVEGARAHGLPTIGVTWGIGSVAELEGAGVDVLLRSPGELVALLADEGPPAA